MTRCRRMLPGALAAAITFIFAASPPLLWAKKASIPFSATRIIFEKNASGNDLGIQVFLDATAWKKVEIFNPDGRRIFEVEGKGTLRRLGLTELFFESEEPSLDEVPLSEILARFPEGTYTFVGTTVDGEKLFGTATLTHDIPDGPVIDSPPDGAVVDPNDAVIAWQAVTTPPGIQIVNYQVIVEGGEPSRVFSVHLPASTTSVTVPPEFLAPGTAYKVEVLAIEVGGNQTITESSFQTQ